MPCVLALGLVGAYAVERTPTALVVTMGAGVVGLLMERARVPVAPAVLGFVLGPTVEEMALTSLMKSGGDPAVFLSRPVAMVLAGLTCLVWLGPALRALMRRLSWRGGSV
jgi:TctA family transporter